MLGRVKWFNDTKGYGFITARDTPEDYFVHYTAIHKMEGYRSLLPGQDVTFDGKVGPRGLTAVNVKVVDGMVPAKEG